MDIKVKSGVTRRLQDSGLWKEANGFKEEQRLRLRGEGVRKEDANDRSWELMIEKYPERDVETQFGYLHMFLQPPSLVMSRETDEPIAMPGGYLLPAFLDTWQAFCFLFGAICEQRPGVVEKLYSASQARILEDREGMDEQNAGFGPNHRNLTNWGLTTPVPFLDVVENVFRRALEGLTGTDELSEATRAELSGYLSSFPDVKQAVESGWTTPECIVHFSGKLAPA